MLLVVEQKGTDTVCQLLHICGLDARTLHYRITVLYIQRVFSSFPFDPRIRFSLGSPQRVKLYLDQVLINVQGEA